MAQKINQLSKFVQFYVLASDTYGSATKQFQGINCTVLNLSTIDQPLNKLAYLNHLGANTTLSVGNGFNDKEMLKHSVLGIALLQEKGLYTQTLMTSDIVCTDIWDVLNYLEKPNRLKATLKEAAISIVTFFRGSLNCPEFNPFNCI